MLWWCHPIMLCDNHAHIRGLQTSTRWTSRLRSKQVAGQQTTGQISHRAGGHTPRSQDVGARQEATSEAKDYFTTEANKVNVVKEATGLCIHCSTTRGRTWGTAPYTVYNSPAGNTPHLVPLQLPNTHLLIQLLDNHLPNTPVLNTWLPIWLLNTYLMIQPLFMHALLFQAFQIMHQYWGKMHHYSGIMHHYYTFTLHLDSWYVRFPFFNQINVKSKIIYSPY